MGGIFACCRGSGESKSSRTEEYDVTRETVSIEDGKVTSVKSRTVESRPHQDDSAGQNHTTTVVTEEIVVSTRQTEEHSAPPPGPEPEPDIITPVRQSKDESAPAVKRGGVAIEKADALKKKDPEPDVITPTRQTNDKSAPPVKRGGVAIEKADASKKEGERTTEVKRDTEEKPPPKKRGSVTLVRDPNPQDSSSYSGGVERTSMTVTRNPAKTEVKSETLTTSKVDIKTEEKPAEPAPKKRVAIVRE